MTPKQMNRYIRLCVNAHKKKPKLTSTPPVRDTQKGPNLSCSRPATINVRAKTATAMVKIVEVSARFQ